MGRVRRQWLVVVLAGATAAACTGEPARSAPTGPPPATVPAPDSTLDWTGCALPAEPGAVVRAVLPGGDGVPWTAVGQEGGGSAEVRPAAWTAADGCAWSRSPVRAITPEGGRTGFSAVARRGRVVAALGRSYSKVHGNARPTLWRSTGGGPLREVQLLRELFGGESGISVDALVSGPDALLAVGSYITRDKNVAVTVWRSADGAGWDRLAPGAGQTSSPGEQLLTRDMAAGPLGSVIVGTAFQVAGGGRDSFDAAAWYAAGGERVWRRADLSRSGLVGAGDQRLLAAAPVGPGYAAVAAVRSDSGFELRSALSEDGMTWSAGGPLPLARALPGADRPTAEVAAVGPGLVAGTAAEGRAALWRSADGRQWRPETVPGPADGATGVVLAAGADRLVLVVQTADGPRMHLARTGG
ncbi:MAG TPA: hypothetical protein VI357_04715 [Mycobacteriales bacterium]